MLWRTGHGEIVKHRMCKQALQARMSIPSKRIVSNKPVPMNKRGQRRFNPQQVNQEFINLD